MEINKLISPYNHSSRKGRKIEWKAVKKIGGKPIIYQVEPDWSSLVNRIDYEYITYSAKIISSIDFKNF